MIRTCRSIRSRARSCTSTSSASTWKRKCTVSVPLVLTGKPVGVVNGGQLAPEHAQLPIAAKPTPSRQDRGRHLGTEHRRSAARQRLQAAPGVRAVTRRAKRSPRSSPRTPRMAEAAAPLPPRARVPAARCRRPGRCCCRRAGAQAARRPAPRRRRRRSSPRCAARPGDASDVVGGRPWQSRAANTRATGTTSGSWSSTSWRARNRARQGARSGAPSWPRQAGGQRDSSLQAHGVHEHQRSGRRPRRRLLEDRASPDAGGARRAGSALRAPASWAWAAARADTTACAPSSPRSAPTSRVCASASAGRRPVREAADYVLDRFLARRGEGARPKSVKRPPMRPRPSSRGRRVRDERFNGKAGSAPTERDNNQGTKNGLELNRRLAPTPCPRRDRGPYAQRETTTWHRNDSDRAGTSAGHNREYETIYILKPDVTNDVIGAGQHQDPRASSRRAAAQC